jgi:urea carboxylase
VLTGDRALTIEPTTLRLADHVRFCAEHADEISAFRDRQQAAFNDERARWALADANRADTESFAEPPPVEALPDGVTLVEAGFLASVWKVVVEPGQRVSAGDPLVVLEAMKMETTISAPTGGQVVRVMAAPGQDVTPGQPLVALLP